MALTTKARVFYPDGTEKASLKTLFSTLASSIENGLGKRLGVQEVAVGLKASADGWALPQRNEPLSTDVIPFSISAGLADFNQGFSFTGGIATITTKGMYLVTASLGPKFPDTGSAGAKIQIRKNSTIFASSEVPLNKTVWVNSQATSVINCVPGDTISGLGCLSGLPSTGHVTSPDTSYLSIAMVQAVP